MATITQSHIHLSPISKLLASCMFNSLFPKDYERTPQKTLPIPYSFVYNIELSLPSFLLLYILVLFLVLIHSSIKGKGNPPCPTYWYLLSDSSSSESPQAEIQRNATMRKCLASLLPSRMKTETRASKIYFRLSATKAVSQEVTFCSHFIFTPKLTE